ncbi:MAG: LemA family protein [Sphingomonadales bacterium]|nr:LemA family protein [Sphingomonadales bacterium]
MKLTTMLRGAFAAAAAFSLAACGINSVPTKEEAAKARWADVESAYQRRADLIPNLVSTVRGAAASEGKILEDVMNARSRATAIQLSADDLDDPAKFQAFEQAQGELGSTLSRLMMVTENYPQLRSQEGFLALQDQLEGTENRIDNARTKYNAAVQDYNTTIRTFPDSIGANIIHGAEPMQGFKAKPGADVAPEVNFDAPK